MGEGSLKASRPELKARPGYCKSELGIRWINSLSMAAGFARGLGGIVSWAAEREAPGALCAPVSGCVRVPSI